MRSLYMYARAVLPIHKSDPAPDYIATSRRELLTTRRVCEAPASQYTAIDCIDSSGTKPYVESATVSGRR